MGSSWKQKIEAFSGKRDDIASKYSELRDEVTTSESHSAVTDERFIEEITASMDDLFIDTLELLSFIVQTDIDDTGAGRCFPSKVRIIRFIIQGVVETCSVKERDFGGILDIISTHIGRLTLDAYAEWDLEAETMDRRAEDVFNHYQDMAKLAVLVARSGSRRRDMRWFRNCWHQVNWYHPRCDCSQCSWRVDWCGFRKVSWGQKNNEPVNRLGIFPGAETLDPLEVWREELNGRLGETY